MSSDAALWDIDPQTIYLNHGSFGPSPVEVRKARERWSAALERQPMRFFLRKMEDQLDRTAHQLAAFLGTTAARLALIDNSTMAMNIAAASIDLQPDDEVLLTDHEYGAVRNIWSEVCRRTGAKLKVVRLPFPLQNDATVQAVADALTDRTRVLVFSHVTSTTAAILPAQEICRVARAANVVTVIDGPHAIGMLDLNIDQLGCDFYCVSCHKWLCAPFGSGFLWAHPRHHGRIRCPVVSWGGSMSGRSACWQDRLHWMGTRDPAPLLAIGDTLNFWDRIGLETYRRHAHELICTVRKELLSTEGIGPLCTPADHDVVSMSSFELPQPSHWQPGYHGHEDALQSELRTRFGIETPVASWNGRRFLRVSAHLYNTQDDVQRLIAALHQCLTAESFNNES